MLTDLKRLSCLFVVGWQAQLLEIHGKALPGAL